MMVHVKGGSATGLEPAATQNASHTRRGRRRQRRSAKDGPVKDGAARRAGHAVAFVGHVVAWAMVVLFLLVVAGFKVALIVALAWGIGLSLHGYFAVVAPVVHQRWLEEERRGALAAGQEVGQAEKDSDRALEMKQLSAAVAHEIRNPITAARSLVQQIGEDPNAAHNAEFAELAVNELDRVERSIRHLLSFAREDELRLDDIQLNAVIDSALNLLEPKLSAVAVSPILEEDDALRGDFDKLRQVVVNLLSNALDALAERNPDEPCIQLTTGKNLAGNALWLRIRDNGSGIPDEKRSDIFALFHSSKPTGTGIGLAVTRKLLAAHGGGIELVDEVRDGAEFVVTLPIDGRSLESTP